MPLVESGGTTMPRGKYPDERVDVSTQMTPAEMKAFVRNHFEEFVNRKNLTLRTSISPRSSSITGMTYRRAWRRGPLARSRTSEPRTRDSPTFMWRFWISSPRAIESRSEILGPERRPRPARGTSFRGS